MIDELAAMLYAFLGGNSSWESVQNIQAYLQDSTLRQDPEIERLFTAVSSYVPTSVERGDAFYGDYQLREIIKDTLTHIHTTYKSNTTELF
jgi:hypothetical protein